MCKAILTYRDSNSPLWSSVSKVGEIKNQLSDVVIQIDEARKIVENKLDKVMSIFKWRDPGFCNGYQAARVIVEG